MGDASWQGKVAIITGGAQGIGKCLVQGLLTRGAKVVIADSDAVAGAETAGEYAALGELRFVATEVAREAGVAALIAATLGEFGRLDLLVNNAAIGKNAPPAELSLADWDRVLAVNLTGPFLCAKHAAAALRASRGTIINIASTRAFMSEPNTEAYAASKGGVVALTHALAASLGPEVRVNAIAPGWIETRDWQRADRRQPVAHSDADRAQHPVGRVGTPADILAALLWLAGPDAGFVTGTCITVDGGMTHKMIYV